MMLTSHHSASWSDVQATRSQAHTAAIPMTILPIQHRWSVFQTPLSIILTVFVYNIFHFKFMILNWCKITWWIACKTKSFFESRFCFICALDQQQKSSRDTLFMRWCTRFLKFLEFFVTQPGAARPFSNFWSKVCSDPSKTASFGRWEFWKVTLQWVSSQCFTQQPTLGLKIQANIQAMCKLKRSNCFRLTWCWMTVGLLLKAKCGRHKEEDENRGLNMQAAACWELPNRQLEPPDPQPTWLNNHSQAE